MNAELFHRLHPLFSAFLTPETAGILLTLARPALRLVPGASTAVHLGGSPLLPAGEPWPTASGRPLAHLGTIDFAGLPPLDDLPGLGHAAFYYSGTTRNAWDDHDVPESWRVYAHDMKPATPPVPPGPPEGQSWAASPFWSLPNPLDPALDLLEQARPGTLGSYRPLYESWLDQIWPSEGPRHQLGGWPILLETDRPMGPPASCEPTAPKPPPYIAPETTPTKPPPEPRTDQVIRLSDYRRPSGNGERRRPDPDRQAPIRSASGGRRAAEYELSAPRPASPATQPSNVPPTPRGPATAAAIRPGEGSDIPNNGTDRSTGGQRSPQRKPKQAAPRSLGLERPPKPVLPSPLRPGSAPVIFGCDHLAGGADRDPAFLHPRIPRRSVSVLPPNVSSIRLDEVRAAIAAARSRSSGVQEATEALARQASDARRLATRRLTDLLRERLNKRRLILQLDSDPSLGWFWGDPGRLYFTVQPNDPLETAWLNRHAL